MILSKRPEITSGKRPKNDSLPALILVASRKFAQLILGQLLSVLRNKLEAEAVLGIVGFCDEGTIELVSSDALVYEMEQNTLLVRREHAAMMLSKAVHFATSDSGVENRAATFVARGIKPMDAVHVALAEAAGADYFCSCDDRMLRKLKRMQDIQFKPVTPFEIIEEL